MALTPKDYRVSHKGERKSAVYEHAIYKKGSYDDMMWQAEQPILVSEVTRYKDKTKQVHYLDFACGTGRITQLLEPFVDTSVGVDIAESMLDIARPKLLKTRLICADLTQDDVLGDMTFNYITAFRFFLNAGPELGDKAMSLLVPKLTRDGMFVFNMHGNLWSHRLLTKIWFTLRGRRLNVSSYWRAKKLAESHGLMIDHWYGWGLVPKVFYRIFGAQRMFALDALLARIPLMRYVAYNLIFVCSKK